MKSQQRTYVLIAGAWHGGWVWRDVMDGLRAMGHSVTAPTLTGLGERCHVGADTADLETHIQDVVAHIEMECLYDVTLVGWSYGGAVIAGALARLPQRIRSMIYIDAFLPENGEAVIDAFPPEARQIIDPHMRTSTAIPPLPVEMFGLADPKIIDLVKGRATAQPWRTFYQPVHSPERTVGIPEMYICCTGFGLTTFFKAIEKMKVDPAIRVEVLETGHMCMLSDPLQTIELLACAA